MLDIRAMAWTQPHPDMTDRPITAGRRHLLQEDIRRHTLELLDRRWHQLWGSFGVSMILLGFGGKLLWTRTDTHWPQALGLFSLGIVVWLLHHHIRQGWTRVVRHRDDWLATHDQGLVAASMWVSVFAPTDAEWWPMPVLLGGVYGVWRLHANARRHWRSWFFAQARCLLRQTRSR
jgi:hypothetical protein